MTKGHINELLQALAPTDEDKEIMLHRIQAQSAIANASIPRRERRTPSRRVKPALWAAAIAVVLTTTAFAAAYKGLDEAFVKFLNPVNHEQNEYLSNGAYSADKQVTSKSGTVTIKQVIGDSNLTYILLDFAAPEGTALNAARYRFEYGGIDSDQSFQSVGFRLLDDGRPDDNRISLVMSVMTEESVAGQKVRLTLKDLQAAPPYPGIFETIIPDTWETDLQLNFKEYSSAYPVRQSLKLFGYAAVLKSVSVSPISITLKLESDFLKEINEAAGRMKEVGPNEYLDPYPVTIRYRDGTSETTRLFNGLHLSKNLDREMLMIKTFDKVINDKEIDSIEFFGREIPISTM